MTTPYRHIKVVYQAKHRLVGWAVLLMVICRYALLREVFWRSRPSVVKYREFESDAVVYIAEVRFSYGQWFGPWHPIQKTKPPPFGFF